MGWECHPTGWLSYLGPCVVVGVKGKEQLKMEIKFKNKEIRGHSKLVDDVEKIRD